MENIIKIIIKLKFLLGCENVEKNNSGVPPPVTIKQSSSAHSYGGTRSPRFGGSVGRLPKPDTQNFHERMEKASLDEATNHEQIRQSLNPLAMTSSSSSFHSTQGSGQLVVVGIKIIQGMSKKEIY